MFAEAKKNWELAVESANVAKRAAFGPAVITDTVKWDATPEIKTAMTAVINAQNAMFAAFDAENPQ